MRRWRWLWPTSFVTLLAVLQLAAGGSVVREIPAPVSSVCPRPAGVKLVEAEDGRLCVEILMDDDVQWTFCESIKKSTRESSGARGSARELSGARGSFL